MWMWLFFMLAHASTCPLKETEIWGYYADEWGHNENKYERLTRQDIRIGSWAAQWVMWPKTCQKEICDVSFFLKLKNGCWKPLISVQGQVRSLHKGDWSELTVKTVRSMTDKSKTKDVLWRFNPQTFTYEIKH